jgi:hypothetical protein
MNLVRDICSDIVMADDDFLRHMLDGYLDVNAGTALGSVY